MAIAKVMDAVMEVIRVRSQYYDLVAREHKENLQTKIPAPPSSIEFKNASNDVRGYRIDSLI
ncbi:MAG: hypothetical protein H3C47_09890 [Candidatus Cloacimonetes bacterium]|nr:hypothetical protein [Candidatus Cloacimonadota bacterium]